MSLDTVKSFLSISSVFITGILFSMASPSKESETSNNQAMAPSSNSSEISGELASFGAGCFWCVEAVFETLDGVTGVESGYMGGQIKDPDYRSVCSGTTGHAEIVQITFDPEVIDYETLLDWFWRSHDPTTLNRQGADRGTQYRSAIFYHSDAQKTAAQESMAKAQESFRDPIVTEITEASKFYPAEDYHQDYYRLNGSVPYCQMVIAPKLRKLGIE